MAGRRSPKRRIPPWVTPLVLGVVIGAAAALALHSPRPRPEPTPGTAVRPAARPHPAVPKAPPSARRPAPQPPVRNPEAAEGPAVAPPPEQQPAPRSGERPRVAVIFDDAGYSIRNAQEVMALGRPVTISVLPDLPFSRAIAEEAPGRGVQVILHLPVQPDNPSLDLGPGGITVGMSDDEIERMVAADLATVPGAVGANNHMGSRGTADPRVMRAVIRVFAARHLFFVDSLTSPRSVAAATARELGVPTAVRAVFLDNLDDEAYVRGQLQALIKVALARGEAVAIGHVGKVTARVLREMLPAFDEAGVRLVPVSALVR